LTLPDLTQDDLNELRRAAQSLEHPSLAARLTMFAGKPIELIGNALPAPASQAIAAATTTALEVALQAALRTIRRQPRAASRILHKALATASGAAGGAFGLATLPIELPISTIVMLRSIADIARSEGEDMSDPETALACVQVFALGSRPGAANPAESEYFVVRGMLAKSVTHAARFIAERGILDKGGPLLVRFIAQVASRFGTVVTQKLAAQAIPVIGAVGGAAVNYAFIEHFQEVARGHFAVRRLERVYGKDPVRQEYERFAARG
jgi:EcsC protein family